MSFERSLRSVPMVLVSVTSLKAHSENKLEYSAKAVDITNEGFNLEFKVFCDTFVEEAEVHWFALG